MIYTALHEAFFTYIKVAFFAAACISFPMFAVQIWKFVAPGLYKNEQRAFLPFLIATPVLFSLGAAMVYFLVIPLAWQFFLSFETTGDAANMAMELEPKVDQYLSLVMRLIFAFGVSFELPVLIVLMAQVGMVSTEGSPCRKYAIVGVCRSCIPVTPPDVISQVLLAVPIILLYESRVILYNRADERPSERGRATCTTSNSSATTPRHLTPAWPAVVYRRRPPIFWRWIAPGAGWRPNSKPCSNDVTKPRRKSVNASPAARRPRI